MPPAELQFRRPGALRGVGGGICACLPNKRAIHRGLPTDACVYPVIRRADTDAEHIASMPEPPFVSGAAKIEVHPARHRCRGAKGIAVKANGLVERSGPALIDPVVVERKALAFAQQ